MGCLHLGALVMFFRVHIMTQNTEDTEQLQWVFAAADIASVNVGVTFNI